MLKSPEEYFSEMDFSLGPEAAPLKRLNSGERAFIQKYLGEDALKRLQEVDPEPHFKPVAQRPIVRTKFAEPKIEVVQKKIEIAPEVAAPIVAPSVAPKIAPAIDATESRPKIAAPAAEKIPPLQVAPTRVIDKETTSARIAVETATPAREKAEKRVEVAEKILVQADVVARQSAVAEEKPPVAREETLTSSTSKKLSAAETATALREKLKLEDEIQMVSFYVSGQLFLLPVAAIQEVLRHMELVKVPRAPDFVAGVINLRGRVTPLVHLSALLTDASNSVYDEKNFVIICGSDNLQLGLIIDRISGMHLLPQSKIIWNAESKLGESAEYLLAIANLDDKVCGVVAPEIITQKILAQD